GHAVLLPTPGASMKWSATESNEKDLLHFLRRMEESYLAGSSCCSEFDRTADRAGELPDPGRHAAEALHQLIILGAIDRPRPLHRADAVQRRPDVLLGQTRRQRVEEVLAGFLPAMAPYPSPPGSESPLQGIGAGPLTMSTRCPNNPGGVLMRLPWGWQLSC